MQNMTKRIIAILLCIVMIGSVLPAVSFAAEAEYTLYPTPHAMTYQDGSYELKNMNVIYGSGMDAATKTRMQETAAQRGLTVSEGNAADAAKTNVYVAIKGSGSSVETYITDNYTPDADLFTKIDAHYVASNNGEIVVLGKDVDSCFYGLTSLYHILGQLESNTIRNFTIQDYADVASRGFIEGYYGNPWSTQDRANLMTWGGYYKLNSYFYAPKDDPKHNSDWRTLYTAEEIENDIKPLAQASTNSKCQFIYALHPYMNDRIDYSSTASYEADLAVLKAKFKQVIDAGVRQIALMSDDVEISSIGQANYIKTLEDLSSWLTELQGTYPDLKLTMPCVAPGYEYAGYGQSYYRDLPENVQIMMTGGQVWGYVSQSFTDRYYSTVGRGAYMWINWPCTDNSKNHLIMGGYDEWLQTGVDPSKLVGIVLNPMQQSEPSKVAIFGNACYCWNMWESAAEADAAWEASFSAVNHNSMVPNENSDALKELSKHMINQAMTNGVVDLQESVDLKDELNAFKNKLTAGTYTQADIDSLIEEFTVIQNAAKTFRATGNQDIANQIVYWLDCWDDTTESVISYLKALSAILNYEGDAAVWGHYAAGRSAYESSRNHPLWYIDHLEYAEAGVQHIVPFMRALGDALVDDVEQIVFPAGRPSSGGTGEALTLTAFDGGAPGYYQTNVLSKVVDGNTTTPVWYSDSGRADQYIGVNLGRIVKLGDVTFTQDSTDRFYSYDLQYSTDGINYTTYGTYSDAVLDLNLAADDIEAQYVRFVNKSATSYWVKIYEIAVADAPSTGVLTNRSELESWSCNVTAEESQLVTTGSLTLAPNEYIGLDLGRIKDLTAITVADQGALTLQVSKNNVDWEDTAAGETTLDGRYVRLINKTASEVTVNLTEFRVTSLEVTAPHLHSSNVGINNSWGTAEDCRENGAAFDGDVTTMTEFADYTQAGEYIIYDIGQVRDIRKLEIYCGGAAKNYIRDAVMEISTDLNNWTPVLTIGDGVKNTGEADVTCVESDAGYSQATSTHPNYVSIEGTVEPTAARYIRIRMTADNDERAVMFNEIEINDGEYASITNDPTFETSSLEAQGYIPQYVVDGNLSTSYKPGTDEAGYLLYTFSDNLDANYIHVVQQTDSNAKVSLYAENDGKREWIDMGTLDESLVKLTCDNDLNLAMKIEWEAGNAPVITEIVRFSAPEPVFTKVTLAVGESKTVADVSGNLTNANVSALDTAIATVELTGKGTSSLAAGSSVTTLESGAKYLLVNNRASKTMLNTSASNSEAAAGTMSGLSLNGTTASVAANAVWIVTYVSDGVYTVQDADGKYLTIGNNSASVVDEATNVDLVYAGSYWNIDMDGYYLNDSGNKQICASGWNGVEPSQTYDAATDAGSRWTIYKVNETTVIGATDITFTGVAPGETSVEIGGMLYEIEVTDGETDPTTPEVTEPNVTEPDSTEPDGTEPDGTEPDGTEPDSTEPDGTAPDGTEPDGTEPEDKPVVPECPKDETCVLSQFADIKVDDWYHDGIHFCVEEGIMNGMGEGVFAPNEPTTRAQLVTMLYRLEGEPTIEGKTEPFADVAETDWFYAPIVWAYNNKVVNGISDTEFAPNANVTREQVATILYRFLESPEGTGKLDEFPDVAKVSDYAKDALVWAVGAKLITGVAQPDGTTLLDPAGNATRAQIATILMRHLTA